MLVSCVPLTDFVHGQIDAHEGRPFQCDDSIANDLERAGLIRITLAQRRVDQALVAPAGKLVDTVAGKAPDDGAGQPSSSSPAAPASPTMTSRLFRPGSAKPQKTGG